MAILHAFKSKNRPASRPSSTASPVPGRRQVLHLSKLQPPTCKMEVKDLPCWVLMKLCLPKFSAVPST